MIRLGHIEYSNCFPIHAELLEQGSATVTVIRGTPARLNQALVEGGVDVAPASSIEFARHAGRYRVLPEFVIGSHGAVHSILLESTRPFEELQGARIAVPTASATSVVLLKVLLRIKYNINAHFEWFAQEAGRDPVAEGATAALWIGDVALRRGVAHQRYVYDLGSEWTSWTNLPFAFAVWQTTLPAVRHSELEPLLQSFHRSRARVRAQAAQMAAQHAADFGMKPQQLARYWQSLRYEFDPAMQDGLLHFYRLASELGEAPRIDTIAWASQKARTRG